MSSHNWGFYNVSVVISPHEGIIVQWYLEQLFVGYDKSVVEFNEHLIKVKTNDYALFRNICTKVLRQGYHINYIASIVTGRIRFHDTTYPFNLQGSLDKKDKQRMRKLQKKAKQ